MTSSNQLLGRSAAPYVLEHDGRRFEFRALGQVQKSAFRAWLIGRTRELLTLLYSGADLERELKALTRDALAGHFDFGSPTWVEAMGTFDGGTRLAAILADCEPEDILELFITRPVEARQTLDLAVAESMRRHGFTVASANGQQPEDSSQKTATKNNQEEPATPFP